MNDWTPIATTAVVVAAVAVAVMVKRGSSRESEPAAVEIGPAEPETVEQVILMAATLGGVSPELARAIAKQESSLNPKAFNPERSGAQPGWLANLLFPNTPANPSAGLFQIRWSTALSLKRLYPELPRLSRPSDLFDGYNQARYAAALFRDIAKRGDAYRTEVGLVATWNAGRLGSDGKPLNPEYVTLVSSRLGRPLTTGLAVA